MLKISQVLMNEMIEEAQDEVYECREDVRKAQNALSDAESDCTYATKALVDLLARKHELREYWEDNNG